MMRWLSCLLCSTLPLITQAGEMWGLDDEALYTSPSYIMVEAGRDQSGAVDVYGALDLTLYNEHRAAVYLSQNKTNDATENPSRTFGASLTSDPSATISISLGIERRKQIKAIEITTRHASLSLRPGDWFFSVKRERRTLSAFTQRNRRVNLSGDGTVATLGYDGFERWSLMTSYQRNNYNRDLSTLRFKRRFLLNPHSLNAAWSLTQTQKNISLTRYFDHIYLTGAWSRYTSAVDKSIYDYRSIRLSWDATYDWIVELEGGSGKPEHGENKAYASLALVYRW